MKHHCPRILNCLIIANSNYLNFLYPLFTNFLTLAFADVPLTLIVFLQPLKEFFATELNLAFNASLDKFLQFLKVSFLIDLIFLLNVTAFNLEAPLNAPAPKELIV